MAIRIQFILFAFALVAGPASAQDSCVSEGKCAYFSQDGRVHCGVNCEYFSQDGEVHCAKHNGGICRYYAQVGEVRCGINCEYFSQDGEVHCVGE